VNEDRGMAREGCNSGGGSWMRVEATHLEECDGPAGVHNRVDTTIADARPPMSSRGGMG
jgi:hypothetical protein